MRAKLIGILIIFLLACSLFGSNSFESFVVETLKAVFPLIVLIFAFRWLMSSFLRLGK